MKEDNVCCMNCEFLHADPEISECEELGIKIRTEGNDKVWCGEFTEWWGVV